MADLSVHLKTGSDARPNAENVDSEDPYAWMKFGLTPDLKAILESSHTNPGLRPEESGDVDSDPGAFDEIDLQYPSQTTPNPESEMYGGVDPGTDAFDEMGPQYPLLTTASARSPSSLVHNSLLTSSSDLDDSDSNAVDEAVPYVPLEASPSAFLPGAPFRFASEEHYPAPSPAPSFDSHNALQLDLGLGTPAFAQSASVTVPQVITPALPRPSRARTTNVTLPEVTEEDMGPDSDNDASDDEYIPSMRRTTRKHRRVARSSSNASHVTAKRPRPVLPPRNVQLPLPLSSPLSSPGDTFSSFISEANPWLCVCGWEQKNHRMPDLKRHIRSHMQAAGPARWVCRGVPLAQAPARVTGFRTLILNGQVMIGGCNKTFSRRDALRRHLQNENNHCIGEVVEQSP